MVSSKKQYLTVTEFCEITGLYKNTVTNSIKNGIIAAHKPFGKGWWRIPCSEVQRVMEGSKQKKDPALEYRDI